MGNRFFNYYGGKDSMLCYLLPLIPEHHHYVECCAGSLALFFSKKPSYIETINDLSDGIVNFYRCAKRHKNQLWKLIDETLYSETDYRSALKIINNPGKTNKITWAWAFWVVCNTCFAGNIGGGFRYSIKNTSKAVRVFQGKKEVFQFLCSRLENLQILKRDLLRVINQLDSEHTFFYIDPPYPYADQGHYKGYTFQDFSKLLDVLVSIRGMFLLSSYDYPLLNEYAKAKGWNQRRFEKVLTVNLDRGKKKVEVLTFNYPEPNFQKSLFFS